jgi:hypothetical protein
LKRFGMRTNFLWLASSVWSPKGHSSIGVGLQ